MTRVEAKMEKLHAKHNEGRITKGKMENKMQTLERKAKHLHGTISTIQGNIRKQRLASRKASS